MQGPDTDAQDQPPPFTHIRLAPHGRSIQLGQKAKNSVRANVFRCSSNNGPWDSGSSPAAPLFDLKRQFKFEFNNYLRSALTLEE
jgi:hypothetical protein